MVRLRRDAVAVAERDDTRRNGELDPAANAGAPEPETGAATGGQLFARQSVVNVKLIYAGLLMSLALPPLAIIAAVFAHRGRQTQPNSWLATHYTYQIRTFWIGLCANLCAYALSFVGIGLLMFTLIAVWLVARAVHGITAIAQRRPLEDPYAVIV